MKCEFKECPICATKSEGSMLCESCIHNSRLIRLMREDQSDVEYSDDVALKLRYYAKNIDELADLERIKNAVVLSRSRGKMVALFTCHTGHIKIRAFSTDEIIL